MSSWYDEVPTAVRAPGTVSSTGPQDARLSPPVSPPVSPRAPETGPPDARRWSGRRTAVVAVVVLGLTSVGGVAAAMATPDGISGPAETRVGGGPGGFPGDAPGGQTGRGLGRRGQGFPGAQGQPGQPGQPGLGQQGLGQQGFPGRAGTDPQQVGTTPEPTTRPTHPTA